MGRRVRGAALRASKRIKLADKESTDTKAEYAETREVASKKDEELFVLDTTAILPSKKQLEKREKKVNDPRRNPSLKEQAQIEKLVQTHSSDQLKQLVEQGNAISRRATRKGVVQPTFDLWGEERPTLKDNSEKERSKNLDITPVVGSGMAGIKPAAHVESVTRPAMPPSSKRKAVAIEVAKSGQSYNPDKVQHQRVLHEAIEVEQKRHHAEMEAKAPISTGMSAETRKYLITSDTDDSDSEDDKNAEEGDETGDRAVEKIQKKLTRAERNKQKRVRVEQKAIESRKRQKKLQNAVGEAKVIVKHLSREEIEQNKRREEVQKLKEANERTKGIDVYNRLSRENPIHAPTFPVSLSSELKQTGGSLRTIRPKGSLLTDRMVSLADRDMMTKKQVKKKKRVEGKRRLKMRIKVRGKGHAESKEGDILG
jgi:nucleolar protein 53